MKSQATAASLDDYVARLAQAEAYDRMFFVWHTGDIAEDDGPAGVILLGPQKLSRMVLDAGLSSGFARRCPDAIRTKNSTTIRGTLEPKKSRTMTKPPQRWQAHTASTYDSDMTARCRQLLAEIIADFDRRQAILTDPRVLSAFASASALLTYGPGLFMRRA